MIRKQEEIRRNNVYQMLKRRITHKKYNEKIKNIFEEVATNFGYEPRSVSNIYYTFRKAEEKQLNKTRVKRSEAKAIAQWFKDNVTKWYELSLESSSSSYIKKEFCVNEFPNAGEYSFEFWVETSYTVVKSGDGKNEPIDFDTTISHYNIECTAVYNDEGEELVLPQKYIQEIEDHIYSVLKLDVYYNG